MTLPSQSSRMNHLPLPASGRFVLLRHELPPGGVRPSHWDLMLEAGDSLATWAMPATLPSDQSVDSSTAGVAHRLADHRLAYLNYEGPISGGRGAVHRIDAGRFSLVGSTTSAELVVDLQGESLIGVLRLWQTAQTVDHHATEHRVAEAEVRQERNASWNWSWHPRVSSS